MRRTLLGSIVLLLTAGAAVGCHCGRETSTEASDDEVTASPVTGIPDPVAAEPGPSAEVRALIEAGDAAAIAADLEQRSARLGELAGETGVRARALEQTAESMTGREIPVDPRRPEDLEKLDRAAVDVSSGAVELDRNIGDMRQLVLDLQAEAEALYGRPSP